MNARHRALRWVAIAAALVLLNSSVTFESAWPTPGIQWRAALSIELAVLVLLIAALGSLSRHALRWLTAAWLMLALGRYGEVSASALYGRDINLFWDLRFIPDVLALMARPERVWAIAFAAALAVLIVAAAYATLRWAVGRLGDAMALPRQRVALGALAAGVAALWILEVSGLEPFGTTAFSQPVTGTYVRQARLFARTVSGSQAPAPSPPMDSDLSRVAGADVFLIFIEAYGAAVYERPEFAARLAPDGARLAAAIRETSRRVLSAYVESPTFGGSSWLAHLSLMSGVEVRDHDTSALLMREKRETLVTNFKRRGYRAVAIMPGIWQEWPEGSFYGFDEIYTGPRLDYTGPPFGWWDATDQFGLAKLDALEVERSSRAPLFVFFPTVSTHIPFTPTPPYQPDWARLLTSRPYDEADVARAYDRQPDWLDLGSSYVDSVSYIYQSLSGYIRRRAERDYVMILIGDHQPAAIVAGQGAPWDVPVHIVASREDLLDRFLAHGFNEGLQPRRPSLGPMHAFTPTLLEAFGVRESSSRAELPAY